MTTLAASWADGRPLPGRGGAPALRIEIADRLETVESRWRMLEQAGVLTPYGRYDWVAAFAASGPGRVRVAVVADEAGRPSMILPLAVRSRFGVRTASVVGGRHANFVLPLMRPDFAAALAPARARELLRTIGRHMRADVLSLEGVPRTWDGDANPFADGGRPHASPAYSLVLDVDGPATLARSMSGDARKKMRNKERGLAKSGTVELRLARTPGDVDLILDAFRVQKAARFRELGIRDPFAGDELQAAIRRGCTERLAEGLPAIELYGLLLAGRPVAVLGGAADRRRFSSMFLSFENGEAARFSPGDLLVARVVADCCARGLRVFDLGVGDARYKRAMCDGTEDLVDLVVPVTALGRAAGAALGVLGEAKRRAKADPRIVTLVARLRRGLARG